MDSKSPQLHRKTCEGGWVPKMAWLAALPLMIPLVALMIPIVALLTRHQQTMAQIIHGGAAQGELESIRYEVQELRRQLDYQATLLNDMKLSPVKREDHQNLIEI